MGSRSFIAPVLFLFVIGCASSERFTKYPDPIDLLRSDLNRILADSLFGATVASIKVYSPELNEVLYERQSNRLLRPASNLKVLTSIAAITRLAPEFEFATTVHTDTIDENTRSVGILYLRGGGNSELKTAGLDTLARRVAARGIRVIRGGIVADNSHFDTTWFGKGWMWDDEPYSFGAPLSALSLNKNCVRVTVSSTGKAGSAPGVSIEPPTSYVSLVNNARIVSDTVLQPLKIARRYEERQNTIVIEGELLAGQRPRSELVSVWRPELYAATVFKELLEKAQVRVEGDIRSGKTPPAAPRLATHTIPLDSVLLSVNKMSDNLSAESLLRTLAVVADSAHSSVSRGTVEVNRALSSYGIDTTSFLQVDGSGVSHYNLISPETMVDLLTRVADQPDVFPAFYATLPIAGVDGTLSTRMLGTPAERNVRAKTGTLSGISTLSGYVTTQDRERLVFSIFMQNFIGSSRPYRDAQDAICARLAEFTRSRVDVQTP